MLISLSILSVSQMHLKINQVLIMKKKNHNMFNNEIDFSLKVGRKKEGNYRKTVREKKKTSHWLQNLVPEISASCCTRCARYIMQYWSECHQRKTLNHDSLKIYEELLSLQRLSKENFLNTSFKGNVNNTQIYIIHEKTQISVKSQTFGSTLQREKHQHLNIVGCLTNKENSFPKSIQIGCYICAIKSNLKSQIL